MVVIEPILLTECKCGAPLAFKKRNKEVKCDACDTKYIWSNGSRIFKILSKKAIFLTRINKLQPALIATGTSFFWFLVYFYEIIK